MSDIQITVQGTPNPNAAKFVLDRELPGSGSRSYFDPESAAEDALAASLFEIEGVRALLFVENFITVTKRDDAVWESLVEEVKSTIRAGLAGDGPPPA
jgi:hypothetical protein